jgi:hypothetical protein
MRSGVKTRRFTSWKTGEPLKKWAQYGAFDTAKECESKRVYLIKDAEKRDDLLDKTSANFSRCIASDDPRLK